MSKITELRNQHMMIEREEGVPDGQERYRLTFTDRNTGDVIWLAFNRETRDVLISQMTGGVVSASPADIARLRGSNGGQAH